MEVDVEFINVAKSYGSVQALRGVSFRVPRGVIAGLVGPNGAGKTTSMKILVGALRRDYGDVRVFGYDPWEHPDKVRRSIGFLPEKPQLPPIKVAHLLGYAAKLKHVQNVEKEVLRVARITGIIHLLDKKASTLSAGWSQRVAIALSLIGEPSLLVLDEPASNLDPIARKEIYGLLQTYAKDQKITILLSSHILAEIQSLVDYLIVISRGMIVAEGYISDLLRKAQGLVVAVFHVPSKKLTRIIARELWGLEGVVGVEVLNQDIRVKVSLEKYDTVKEFMLKRNCKIIEERVGDLTDLYTKLLKGGKL